MRRVLLFTVLGCLAGCANRAPFTYPDAAAPGAGGGVLVGALHAVCDRRADRSIGEVYEGDVGSAVSAAMQREMLASGAFARIETLPACVASPAVEELRAQGVDVLVQPSLDELRWELPGHADIAATAFAISLVAGAVGGVAYGLTDTEVFGRTAIQATVTDTRRGSSDTRTWRGEVRATTDKMSADTEDTRRDMAARSFAAAMQAFRTDMQALANEGPFPGEAGGSLPP